MLAYQLYQAIVTKLHDSAEKQFNPALRLVAVIISTSLSVCLSETPESSQRAQYLDLKKKFRSRREQVIIYYLACIVYINSLQLFARQSKHVPDKYRSRKWDALSIHYMSEEEDGPDGVVLVKNFCGILIVSIIVHISMKHCLWIK